MAVTNGSDGAITAGQYDAIVIGGGHNGLVTAAYLGKAGLRTIVLERRGSLGGAAATPELAPGVRGPTLAHPGGRVLHALNRYQIIEVEEQFPTTPPPNFMWLGVHQLMTLLQFGNCLNVEARSLLACLHTLW